MTSKTTVKLNNGLTNRIEADFDPLPVTNWHPSQYAIYDAELLAAELLAGEDAKPDFLGITAQTDFVPGEKWSCDFSGKILQDGIEIGTFDASTSYRFD